MYLLLLVSAWLQTQVDHATHGVDYGWNHFTQFTSSVWEKFSLLVTNGQGGTELTFVLVSLMMVLLTSFVLATIMIRRKPRYLLDYAILAREVGFMCLLGAQFLFFYLHISINLWVRSSIYMILFISCLSIIISIAQENTMTVLDAETARRKKYKDDQESTTFKEKSRRKRWEIKHNGT